MNEASHDLGWTELGRMGEAMAAHLRAGIRPQ
jgi:hypothetical protein